MGTGRTHFASTPKNEGGSGGTSRLGRGRPHEPWQYGNPNAGPLSISDSIHWVGYAAPYIIGVLFLPAFGILVRLLFGSSRPVLLLGVFLMTVIGVALTYATWDEASPRKLWVRRRAAVTIAWVFGSCATTLLLSDPIRYELVAGPDDAWWSLPPRWFGVQLLVGVVLAIWWTIGALPAVKGDGTDAANGAGNALIEALGLGQSTTRGPVKDDGTTREIPIRLKGATIEALRSATGLIAVATGIGRGRIKVVEDYRDASAPTLILQRNDPLELNAEPPPPSRPGGSIEEPILLGTRINGNPCETVRHVARYGGRHTLIQGMTGGGKTNLWWQSVYEMSTRCDVVLFHSDTRKLGQSFGNVAPAYCRVMKTISEVKKFVRGMVMEDGLIAYRSATLGAQNLAYWTPDAKDHLGNPMPAIGITFEEASALADALNKPFREMVETLRSVGCFGDFSVQRASTNIVSGDSRAQFGEGMCLPVMRDEDAAMVLGEATLEAGAKPELWGPRLPATAGRFYRECGPEEEHAVEARSWDWDAHAERLRTEIAEWAPKMAWGRGGQYLDPGSAAALGEAWTELQSGADYALAHGWVRTGDGGWVPPKPGQVTVTVTSVTQDPVTQDVAVVQPTVVQPVDHETDDDDPEETEEMAREMDDARDEVAAEMLEDDELDADDADDPPVDYDPATVPEGEDFEMEAGTPLPDGSFLDYRGRVLAAADVFDRLTDGRRRKVRTTVIVDRWLDVEGIGAEQRPAMNRILRKLVAVGQAEDPGRGSWVIDPTAGEWLRRHADELAGSPDEDEDDDE